MQFSFEQEYVDVYSFAVKLLVTTKDAVCLVDLNGSSTWDNVVRIGNLSNPRGIIHDYRGGYIFWSEELDDVTVIKRRSVTDGSTSRALTLDALHFLLGERRRLKHHNL